MPLKRYDVLLCCGSACVAAGAYRVKEQLVVSLAENNLTGQVNIMETGCMGPCDYAPLMMVYPEGILYKKVKPEDIPELVREHFLKGNPLKRLMLEQSAAQLYPEVKDLPFYQKQLKITMANCGIIDPEKIEDYIATGGYEALGKVLTGLSPEQTISLLKKSGLRGRGGAGFPTWEKCEIVYSSEEKQKYIICNGDEGDPGTYIGRTLLEGDPHRILEGMLIAAYAAGASEGFFFIRAEYPLASKRMKKALQQAAEQGLLGKNIFSSGFSFTVEVRTGAGAFVSGEETALISSIQGRRGEPASKPPYPAISGLWGKPTLVNSVETLANLPAIFSNGPAWFSKIGTENSKGTKIFSLSGNLRNPGLMEVPLGITLRELIFDIGGGMGTGSKLKAVQIGGPSGGFLPPQYLDVRVDFESLGEKDVTMGSGGIIVIDDTSCMIDLARYFLQFSLAESCGKCTPCRVGLKEMYHILERITQGKGEVEDLQKLEVLGSNIRTLSLCGFGRSAPSPVLSTLRYFHQEYEMHIIRQRCPAKVCTSLLHFKIDKDRCISCALCVPECPVDCINVSLENKYEILQEECIKCGECMNVCPVNAIDRLPGISREAFRRTIREEKLSLYE
ncbi:MAG: NADH-quinone oxidoreductase subunit NuoF [Candidatus Cloacimonetes bacterium]|nr:NADH-quinone oxidoreductase subunit NuoF [Candidatus Cloacimonadota bacterium]